MQRTGRRRVALWILICTCYTMIATMLYFVATAWSPAWILGACIFTTVICLVGGLLLSERSQFQREITPAQRVLTVGGIFGSIALVALVTAGF